MHRNTLTFAAACLIASGSVLQPLAALAQDVADPRLREVFYDPQAVVTIPVKRGVVTDIVLEANEAITDVASGLGSDCAKPESSWCVAAQPGGRHLFVKPKSTARAANNIAVVTDRRTHSFRFVVLADRDAREPVYRLSVRTAPDRPSGPSLLPSIASTIAGPAPLSEVELIKERLTAGPAIVNSTYSISEGKASQDIVPTLVFDDGLFTYLKFPNNREVPAVFHVLPDGAETVVNSRMEGDLLVIDRVSRRLLLRAGSAVVGVFNDAFDLDGVPPSNGTTVPGVERELKSADAAPATHHGAQR